MGILKKIKRKLFPRNILKYSDTMKKEHLLSKEVFDVNSMAKAHELKVGKKYNGYKVSIKFGYHDTVNYNFRYDKDGLLLLKGISNNYGMIIDENSIVDFSISAKPLNSQQKNFWAPTHNNVKGVCIENDIEVITENNIFLVIQKFLVVNPKEPEVVMWKHHLTHRIDIENPYLEIENDIEIVEDTEVSEMFLTMLPANLEKVDSLYLNNGIKFEVIPNDRTLLRFKEISSSAMFVGNDKSGQKYKASVESLNADDDCESIVMFRSDDIPKFYINHFNGIAYKGDKFKNTHRITLTADDKII